MTSCKVKICGIKDIDALDVAINTGADFIGFVFYGRSPRALTPEQASILFNHLRTLSSTISKVGLFVNPSDEQLDAVSAELDMIQLHGDETPARCAEIKARTECKIMKAIAIKDPADLAQIEPYEPACDWLLFDAKPMNDNESLPGGNGLSFDWTILEGHAMHRPWMLAGGLTPENLQRAIELLRPDAVDVSSGVEDAPGIKNLQKIERFIALAKDT